MKKTKFNVPIYGYDVTVIEIEGKRDKAKVRKEMEEVKCTQEHIDSVADGIDKGNYNGGHTFRNLDIMSFLVIIYPCKDEATRREIINHEKRHVEDRLLQHCGVEDVESSAYLAGYLSRFMY